MARITVEDCLHRVSNRFELVLLAAKRARQLIKGGQSFVEWGDDKPAVVALREIAEGHVGEQHLSEEEMQEEILPEITAAAPQVLPEVTLGAPVNQISESTPFMVPSPNTNNDSEPSSS